VNNGAFHEGLNLAATWNLPVIFVCENNRYATETPFASVTKNTDVASRAAAYKIPGVQVDGNNVLKVRALAGEAVQRARSGEGPTLIECLTYRWYGHHEGDPGTSYRSKEEIATWKANDPIRRLRDESLASAWATSEQFDAVARDVARIIQEAADYALIDPQPDPSTALDHVFYTQGRND
jgi:TPP-dependent pyruvate/acetoin dehydrogenase alpha subunit